MTWAELTDAELERHITERLERDGRRRTLTVHGVPVTPEGMAHYLVEHRRTISGATAITRLLEEVGGG